MRGLVERVLIWRLSSIQSVIVTIGFLRSKLRTKTRIPARIARPIAIIVSFQREFGPLNRGELLKDQENLVHGFQYPK